MGLERVSGTITVKNVHPVNFKNGERSTTNRDNQDKLTSGDLFSKGGEARYTEDEVIEAIEAANNKIEIHNNRLEFSIHEKTKEIMVKVIDKETEEVVKEIPPEKILDIVAGLMELAGLLVDEKI